MEFEYKYTEDCIFKKVCPRKERIGCDEHCPIQPEMVYLLQTSNIPKKFLKSKTLFPCQKDLKAFDTFVAIQDDIENFVKDGRTLYLWSSNVGNGKSSVACKLLKSYLASVCIGNGFKDRGWFEYVPSFLLLSKDFQNEERDMHIEALLKRDFVVLDDIGVVENTNYDITMLLNIINTRYSNNLATIYTSNINPKKLFSDNVRLTDRICSDIVIEIVGNGKRKGTDTYKRGGVNESC